MAYTNRDFKIEFNKYKKKKKKECTFICYILHTTIKATLLTAYKINTRDKIK